VLCNARYPSTSTDPNTRIVECGLPAGHDGAHVESGTRSSWPQKPRPEGRRRAIVRLSEQLLAGILDLPEGVHVVGVRDDFLSTSVLVLIEGDALDVEPTPIGCHPPDLRIDMRWDADEQRLRFIPPVGG
jgi:hypothetical protein